MIFVETSWLDRLHEQFAGLSFYLWNSVARVDEKSHVGIRLPPRDLIAEILQP